MIELRLLWHTVTLTGDDDVVAALVELLPQAEHPMPPRRAMSYRVDATAAGYTVFEEGDELGAASTIEQARDDVYVRMHRRAFEFASLAGWVRLHCVTVDLDDSRVLIAGPSGVGKTTLALRMLADGLDVQGDESALVRTEGSLAVPRAFHLKDGTRALVPELATLIDRQPRLHDVRLVDPRLVRSPWRLRDAPVRHIVLLHRADGPVRCTPIGPGDVLEVLVNESFLVTESKSALVATLASVARRGGHRLSVGDPRQMVEELVRLVN